MRAGLNIQSLGNGWRGVAYIGDHCIVLKDNDRRNLVKRCSRSLIRRIARMMPEKEATKLINVLSDEIVKMEQKYYSSK